jgi:hypothetical protein
MLEDFIWEDGINYMNGKGNMPTKVEYGDMLVNE